MRSPHDHARAWMGKGDHDLVTAQQVCQLGGPYDAACFHCQQAVEKYLKALLASVDEPIPHTHNLALLLQRAKTYFAQLDLGESEVAGLTPYAVELRYDLDFTPKRAETALAVRTAETVRARVAEILPPSALPDQPLLEEKV